MYSSCDQCTCPNEQSPLKPDDYWKGGLCAFSRTFLLPVNIIFPLSESWDLPVSEKSVRNTVYWERTLQPLINGGVLIF